MENKIRDYSQCLQQVIKTANSQLPIKKLLNSIAKTTAKAFNADGCTIMTLSSRREYLTVIAAYGLSEIYLRKGALNVHRSLPDVMQGKIMYIEDVSISEGVQYPIEAEIEKIKSVIGVPINKQGEIIGELRIYNCGPINFGSTEKAVLTSISNIIAIILEKQELYRFVEKNIIPTSYRTSTKEKKSSVALQSIRPPIFSHPSEEQFARILDFYRIEWLHEPRSFPLTWSNGKVTEMFTPDFYLPELDIYIELTTLKQHLITEKNRKIRKLKELYPDVNIRLLNKNDYLNLLVKYGYGPLDLNKVQEIERVLFNDTQIQQRVRILAQQISKDYAGKPLVLVGVLKGVICFISDLMRSIILPVTLDLMAVSYFGTNLDQSVKITKDLDTNIKDRDVLMIEDIVDTGMTLNYILNHLSTYSPSSLKVCTLLDKRVRRLANVPIEYIGFEIPDEFVVGYGLDYLGEYRNLPFIGILNPGIIK